MSGVWAGAQGRGISIRARAISRGAALFAHNELVYLGKTVMPATARASKPPAAFPPSAVYGL